MIHQHHGDGVFALIDDLFERLVTAPDYRLLFDRAMAGVRAQAEAADFFVPVDLPMAVADALGRPVDEARVAAAASTLLWSGADLMDDVADGDLDEAWEGVSASRLALVSTNLLSTMPHLLVGRHAGQHGPVAGAYSQAVSRTLLVMSDGQFTDLDSAGAVRTIDEYLAVVRRKTGAEFALFASTPALLSQAGGEAVAAWVRFGFAYGALSQVFSDTVSTVVEGPRNDLLHGKRTLPVLRALDTLCDADHTSLQRDLDLAAHRDHAAAARAIEAIGRAGGLRYSLEKIELLRFRAAEALPVRMTDLAQGHPLRTLMAQFRIL